MSKSNFHGQSQLDMVSACNAMGLVDPPLVAVFDPDRKEDGKSLPPPSSNTEMHKPCWPKIATSILQDAIPAKGVASVLVGQDVHRTVSSTLDIDFCTYQRLADFQRRTFREFAYVHLFVADISLHNSKSTLAAQIQQWKAKVTGAGGHSSSSTSADLLAEEWTTQVVLLVNPYLLEHNSSEQMKGKMFGFGKTEYESQVARLTTYEKSIKEKLGESSNITVLKFEEGQTGKDIVKIVLQSCSSREKCLPLNPDSVESGSSQASDCTLAGYFKVCAERMANCLRFGLVQQALREADEFRKPKAPQLFNELLAVKHQDRLINLCKKGWLCDPTRFRFEESAFQRLPTLFEHMWYVTGLLIRFYLRVDRKKEALDVWHWFQRIVEQQADKELQSERLLRVPCKVSALLLYTTSYAAVKLAPLVKPWESEMEARLSGSYGRRVRDEKEEEEDLDDFASAACATTTPSSLSFGSVDVRQSLGIPFSRGSVSTFSGAGGLNLNLLAGGGGAAAAGGPTNSSMTRSTLDQASIKSNLGDLVVQLREYFQQLGHQCGYVIAELSMRTTRRTKRGTDTPPPPSKADTSGSNGADEQEQNGNNHFGLDHLKSYDSFLRHYTNLSELAADTYNFAGRDRSESLERWVFAEYSLYFPELVAQAALVVRTAVLPHFASSGWPNLSLRAHQLNLRCQDMFLEQRAMKQQNNNNTAGGSPNPGETDDQGETEEVGSGAYDPDSYVRSCMAVIQLVGDDTQEAAKAWSRALGAVQQDDQGLGVSSLPLDMLFTDMRVDLEVEDEETVVRREAEEGDEKNRNRSGDVLDGTTSSLSKTSRSGGRGVTVFPHGIHCELTSQIDEPLKLDVWHLMPSCVSESSCTFTAEFTSKMDWDDEEEPLHALSVSEQIEGKPTLRQREDGLYGRTSSVYLRPCHAGNYRLTSIEVSFQGGLLSFKRELLGDGPSPVVLRVPRPDPGFRISTKLVGDHHAFSLGGHTLTADTAPPCYVEATIKFEKPLSNKPPERPRPLGCSYSKQRRRSFVGRGMMGGGQHNDITLISDLPTSIIGRLLIRSIADTTLTSHSPPRESMFVQGAFARTNSICSSVGSSALDPDSPGASTILQLQGTVASTPNQTRSGEDLPPPGPDRQGSPISSVRRASTLGLLASPVFAAPPPTDVACVCEMSGNRTDVPYHSDDLFIAPPQFRAPVEDGIQENSGDHQAKADTVAANDSSTLQLGVESGSNAGGAFYFDFSLLNDRSGEIGSDDGALPLGDLTAKIPLLPQFFRRRKLPVVFCCLRDGEPCVSRSEVPIRFADAFTVTSRFQLVRERVFCSWEVENVLERTTLTLENASLSINTPGIARCQSEGSDNNGGEGEESGPATSSHSVLPADSNELYFGQPMAPGGKANLLFMLEQSEHFSPDSDSVTHDVRLELQYTFVSTHEEEEAEQGLEDADAFLSTHAKEAQDQVLLNTFTSEVSQFQSLHSCHFSGLVLVKEAESTTQEAPKGGALASHQGDSSSEYFALGEPITFDVFIEPTQRKRGTSSRQHSAGTSTAAPLPTVDLSSGGGNPSMVLSDSDLISGASWKAGSWRGSAGTGGGGTPEAQGLGPSASSVAPSMVEEVFLQVIADPSEWLIVGQCRMKLTVSVAGGATSTCFKAMPLKEGSLSLPAVQLLEAVATVPQRPLNEVDFDDDDFSGDPRARSSGQVVRELRGVHADITRCRETILVGPALW